MSEETKKEEKEEKVEIKKIVLDLGDGHEITIPIEKAKKLKKALEELFGRDVIKEVREEHHHHWNKWWFDYQPYYGHYSKTNAIGKILDDNSFKLGTGTGNFPDVQFTVGDNLKASFSAKNEALSFSLKD